jgi:nucleoside-diphosphate-sugar epimerase
MKVAITGATGFLGRYIVSQLTGEGHRARCWYRPASSDLSHFPTPPPAGSVDWIEGRLDDERSAQALVQDCDAVVHAALDRPGRGFRGEEGDLLQFVDVNIRGTLRLIEAARAAGVERFVFVSTCAVHEKILDDRPLDETHPAWPRSHYGAHKAALEAFVSSYGNGQGYPICAIRPSGIYGVAHPPKTSKWFELIQRVIRDETVECRGGGKEVHAADVARGISLLLAAEASRIVGETFNCCDRYISAYEVATLARERAGSSAEIQGSAGAPKHQIETGKIRALGLEFGGEARLRQTIDELIPYARRS